MWIKIKYKESKVTFDWLLQPHCHGEALVGGQLGGPEVGAGGQAGVDGAQAGHLAAKLGVVHDGVRLPPDVAEAEGVVGEDGAAHADVAALHPVQVHGVVLLVGVDEHGVEGAELREPLEHLGGLADVHRHPVLNAGLPEGLPGHLGERGVHLDGVQVAVGPQRAGDLDAGEAGQRADLHHLLVARHADDDLEGEAVHGADVQGRHLLPLGPDHHLPQHVVHGPERVLAVGLQVLLQGVAAGCAGSRAVYQLHKGVCPYRNSRERVQKIRSLSGNLAFYEFFCLFFSFQHLLTNIISIYI